MNKKSLKVGKILGIGISSTSMNLVLKKVELDIKSKKKILIVTPNPEIILEAQNDHTLFKILNKANISIPDGIGLVAWHRFLYLPNPKDRFTRLITLFVQGVGVSFSIIFNREWLENDLMSVKGRELTSNLIRLSAKKNLSIFLLGGESGEADRAKLKIKKAYPSLKIESFQGPFLDKSAQPRNSGEEKIENEALERINKFCPDILFVGMTTPRQEKWLYRWLPKINATVGMTVGGTFKYLSGERTIPPAWVNENGLEWLYRLFTGSQNIERIGKAFLEFPAKVFWYKFNL